MTSTQERNNTDRINIETQRRSVLQTVTPIDAQVAEQHDFDRLNKPILRRDQRAKVVWYGTVEPRSRSSQQPKDQPIPHEVLTHEEAHISQPSGTKEPLTASRRKCHLQRSEREAQKYKAQSARE